MKKITLILMAFLIILSLLVLLAEPGLLGSYHWIPRVDYVLLLTALFVSKRHQSELRIWFLIFVIALPLADIGNMFMHAKYVDTLYLHFMIGSHEVMSYILFIIVIPAITWMLGEILKAKSKDIGYNHVHR